MNEESLYWISWCIENYLILKNRFDVVMFDNSWSNSTSTVLNMLKNLSQVFMRRALQITGLPASGCETKKLELLRWTNATLERWWMWFSSDKWGSILTPRFMTEGERVMLLPDRNITDGGWLEPERSADKDNSV